MIKKSITYNVILALFILSIQACGGGRNGDDTPANSAPTANSVRITDSNGGQALVGDSLLGSYTYADVDNDAEGTSTFRWLRNNIAITGVNSISYTVTAEDIDRSISFEVVPVATTGISTGNSVTSAIFTIPIPSNTAPAVSSIAIIDLNGGDPLVGDILDGQYTYVDNENDNEEDTLFRWLRDDVTITNAISTNYTLVADDVGSAITFAVTPTAQTGTSPGEVVTSAELNIPVFVNNPPVASNVLIIDVNGDTLLSGDTLNGNYTYTDLESDLEGTSSFRWLRNGVTISGATSTSYILVNEDSGQPITFEVTPIAIAGALTGEIVTSPAITFNEITDNWTEISAGDSHTLALKNDGSLWSWGSNIFSQLGDGTEIFKTSPVQIGTNTNWSKISAGYYHSLAVKSNGTLWAWGTALGLGTISSREPNLAQIGIETNWLDVSAGKDYSLAIKSDGTLWAWGVNGDGQLGINDTVRDQDTPRQVGSGTTWIQVDAARYHTLALKSDGTLWAWGKNDKGQLGNGQSGKDNKQISPIQIGTSINWAQVSSGHSVGYAHSLALKTDGTLWAWGAGGLYSLGTGDNNDQLAPIQVGTTSNWLSINAGEYASFGIKDNGTLWAWGWNIANITGIAGLSSSATQIEPAQVNSDTNWQFASSTGFHVMALKTTGTIYAWGHNYSGELGIGVSSREQNRSAPTPIATLNNVTQIATGESHSAVIKTDETLWTWGQGRFYELGNDSTAEQTSPAMVGLETNWSKVIAGNYHNLALKTDGTLWAWGFNGSGQLGDGSTTKSPTPVQIGTETIWFGISAGYSHSLAVKTNGTLWAWGSNGSGQLGIGNTIRSDSPIQVGTETKWTQVVAGSSHSLALKNDGTIWAWGRNSSGQLGNGTTTISTSPVQVGTGIAWTQIAAGENHSLALQKIGNDTTLWTWGSNQYGQIGNGTSGFSNDKSNPTQIGSGTIWTQVSAGRSHSLARKADGTLWSWGQNISGQLGDDTNSTSTVPAPIGTGIDWMMITSGSQSSHTLGLRNDGTIESWGSNIDGQLGIGVSGNEQNRKTPTLILP